MWKKLQNCTEQWTMNTQCNKKENRLLTEYLSIRFNFVNRWWTITVYSFNAPTRVKSNFVNYDLWSQGQWNTWTGEAAASPDFRGWLPNLIF